MPEPAELTEEEKRKKEGSGKSILDAFLNFLSNPLESISALFGGGSAPKETNAAATDALDLIPQDQLMGPPAPNQQVQQTNVSGIETNRSKAEENPPAQATQVGPRTPDELFQSTGANSSSTPVAPLRVSTISADSPGAQKLLDQYHNHIRSYDDNYTVQTNPGLQLADGMMDSAGPANKTYRMNKEQFEQQQNFNPYKEYNKNIAAGMSETTAKARLYEEIAKNQEQVAKNDAALRAQPNSGYSMMPVTGEQIELANYASIKRVDNPDITADRVVQQDVNGNIRMNLPSTARVKIEPSGSSNGAIMPGEEQTYRISIIPADASEAYKTGKANFKPIIVEGITRDQLENKVAFIAPREGPNIPGARAIAFQSPKQDELTLKIFTEGAEIRSRGAVAMVNGEMQRDYNDVSRERGEVYAQQQEAQRATRKEIYARAQEQKFRDDMKDLSRNNEKQALKNQLLEKQREAAERRNEIAKEKPGNLASLDTGFSASNGATVRGQPIGVGSNDIGQTRNA